MSKFLAIDPGTHRTGVALFDGDRLVDWWSVEAGRKDEIEDRLKTILTALAGIMAEQGDGIAEVVCERPMGIDSHRPAPQLLTLIARLKSWATKPPQPCAWADYHPSTVLASVRPRGMGAKAPSKLALQLGVKMLYGDVCDPDNVPQDVVDAVAVGHCHLVKRRETEALA